MHKKHKPCHALAALAFAVAGLAASQAANARDLTIVSWGGSFQDAQREIFFAPYGQKIGKKVLDQSWDGGVGILDAKVKVGNPTWDVVEVEAEDLALGCETGLYEKIDWAKVGNKADFIPEAVNDCGVGAIVWNLFTWYYGIPSSSSHALIGGLVGAAVAKSGTSALIGGGLLKTVQWIVLSPLMGFDCSRTNFMPL